MGQPPFVLVGFRDVLGKLQGDGVLVFCEVFYCPLMALYDLLDHVFSLPCELPLLATKGPSGGGVCGYPRDDHGADAGYHRAQSQKTAKSECRQS